MKEGKQGKEGRKEGKQGKVLRGYCMSIEHIYIRCQGSREV